jgi:hypothetical protein
VNRKYNRPVNTLIAYSRGDLVSHVETHYS